jgi:starch phosphorylase
MHSLFTTHTPVPAGHDIFHADLVDRVMGSNWEAIGFSREQFLALGRHPKMDGGSFHMTALSIRLSHRVNAVSERHALTTRQLWRPLWPGRPESEVPIGHVTNGVHLATWMANRVMKLFDRHLGNWGSFLDDPSIWERVLRIPDDELWRTHMDLQSKPNLVGALRNSRHAPHWVAKRAVELSDLGVDVTHCPPPPNPAHLPAHLRAAWLACLRSGL